MHNNKKTVLLANVLLVIAAMIWGSGFVAQEIAAKHIGTFALLAVRFIIGALVLVPVIILLNFTNAEKRSLFRKQFRTTILGGMLCGVFLFVAAALQQIGIEKGAESGKAGFITAMYIVLVPVLGLFLRKKVTALAWIAVCIAPVGLFLLCVNTDRSLGLSVSDLALFGCAVVFACHILAVDSLSQKTNGVLLSCVQFLTTSVLSGIVSLFLEDTSFTDVEKSIWPLLFLGVCSCGIAYTLQIIAQKMTSPTVASLLMSLESVFAVIFGALILGHMLSPRETAGCLIIFSAVILSQIPAKRSKKQ